MRAPAEAVPVVAVDRASKEPLYRQVFAACRDAILAGRLRAGDRMPSTRGLAAELGVSRIPVLAAYAQLLAEGYCEGHVGSGTFVSASLPGEARARPRPRSAAPRAVSRGPAAAMPAIPPWFRAAGPFPVGQVAADAFPYATWRRLVARRARLRDAGLVLYGKVMGSLPLREAIARYLRSARAVTCDAEQVMIVNGSQQALDLVARVLLDPGSDVWMEEPGYWGAREAFRLADARLVPVPVDADGLDVEAGIALCPRPRAVYVTPSHQFPLGRLMSASRRLKLVELAARTGAWIVEDDYDSEFRYEGQPVASLHGLDRDARVLYVGTFSKVLSPALRIGYLVLPEDLVPRFAALRWATDISTPYLHQAALAEFLDEGHFTRHLRRMRALYAERREALVAALERELPDVLRVEGDRAGLYLVALLAKGRRDLPIALAAAERGLRTVPLSWCYLARPRHGFALGFAATKPAELAAAARRLRRVVLEA